MAVLAKEAAGGEEGGAMGEEALERLGARLKRRNLREAHVAGCRLGVPPSHVCRGGVRAHVAGQLRTADIENLSASAQVSALNLAEALISGRRTRRFAPERDAAGSAIFWGDQK